MTYYGFIYERMGTKEELQEYNECLNKIVEKNNISDEDISAICEEYHAIYGC